MKKDSDILTDSFGRKHQYLRISLTDRCNLRCTYCMPEESIQLAPRSSIMSYGEIYSIARLFVKHGVTKIRLTGGEPLVRKDAGIILEKLTLLPAELTITTNGILADKHIDTFRTCRIKKINVSLDSLCPEKFLQITRRHSFNKVYGNILSLIKEGFNVKINVVLVRGFNDNEIIDFVKLTKELPVCVRFIEFMPFDGNRWNLDKIVSFEQILKQVNARYPEVIRLADAANDTSENYQIKGHRGSFAVISSVTRPFCGGCNRIRLTANGHLKNCLFSSTETDLLTPFREGKDIEPIIRNTVLAKKKIRGGMEEIKQLKDPALHSKNRSMTSIGG